MKRSVLEIYALAVCFVTVVCLVVSLGVGIYSLVRIAKPDFSINPWIYDQYRTNDTYWTGSGNRNPCCANEDRKKERPGEAELTRQRQEAFAYALVSEQRDGAQTLVKALIVVLIDIAVFLAHWLVARRAHAGAAA